MRQILKSVFGVIALVAFCSGCVSYTPRVHSGHNFDQSKSYIYGRFNLAPRANVLQMGLVVTSSDKKQTVTFKFEKEADPYVIAVNPGDYLINSLIFATGEGNKEGERPLYTAFSNRVFSVEAGKAYYIGDYEGGITRTFGISSTPGQLIGFQNDWRLKSTKNNFAVTTELIETQIPFLKNIPKNNVFGDLLTK